MDLNTKVSSKDNKIEKLTNDVTTLNERIVSLESEINDFKVREQTLLASTDSNDKAYELLNEEKSRLEERVKKLEGKRDELQNKLNEATEALSNQETTGVADPELEEKFQKLVSENKKLNNKLEHLEESNTKLVESSDRVFELENELTNAQSKIAGLTSELENLKSQDQSTQIRSLEKELEEANVIISDYKSKGGIGSEEYNKLKAEFDARVEAFNELELELSDSQSLLDEYEMPKYGMSLEFNTPNRAFKNFFCIASGSIESNSTIYKTLRKTFEKDSQRTFLILDLGVESTIDSDLGIKGLVSPTAWLTGSDKINNYVRDTAFRNVKALSVATSYMNDLYLLNVDWVRKLTELENVADIVIFNVGCLNNIVTKVLLNSFSKCMRTYVMTKATPLNLRAVSINMTSFINLRNSVELICYNFDSNTSKKIYAKIRQKYKSKVLGPDDAIPFM